MTDRLFDVQVSGYTKGGYGFTLTARDVDSDKLPIALEWIGERLFVAGVRPLLSEQENTGSPPPEREGDKICPIHKVAMGRHEKGNSHWYSHKAILADGTEHWCRGK